MRGDQGEDTLLALYVALVVAALAGAGKLMAVGPLAASATVVVYQLSFTLIDYVNEIFSASTARTFVKHGFIAVSVGLVCFIGVALVPPADGFVDGPAYTRVFGVTPRLAGAGLIAFVIAQLENVWIYDLIRRKRPQWGVMVRAALATAVAQFVDTVIFVGIAFAGTTSEIWRLLFGQYAIKLVLVCISAPLLGIVVAVKRSGDDARAARVLRAP